MSLREGGVVVVMRERRFLMIQRALGILAPGSWCFVGGGIEEGETHEQAVVREFREEVGGVVTPVRKLWTSAPSATLRLHWWLAKLEHCELCANPAEVQALRWCSRDEIALLPDLLESNSLFLREFPTLEGNS
ncbi:MAG: NUDIX domain-containing protein [Phycisphaerae bacterium]